METGNAFPYKVTDSTSISCARIALKKVLETDFHTEVEITRIELIPSDVENGYNQRNVSEVLESLADLPIKYSRVVKAKVIAIIFWRDGSTTRLKAKMSVEMVWFDIPRRPGWVPVFADLSYRLTKDVGGCWWFYYFERKFYECGYWRATPRRIPNCGDCAED